MANNVEPVNILVALPNDTLGGAEQYLKMIAHQFVKRKCNVYVLFLKKQNDNGWHSLSVNQNIHLKYTTASSEKKGMWPFLKNLLALKRVHFEYIFTSHVHVTGVIGLFVRLGLLKKEFFVGRESTSIFKRFTGLKLMMFKFQYWMGYPALDLLICQTNFMKDQLVAALPAITRKLNIQVIPNPIDLDGMVAGILANDKAELYGKYIVSAGRLIPEKGFDILIPVFAEVKKEYPDMKLVILGEGKDREMLTALIAELGLENDVFLPGFVSDVCTYFKHAELCVISSRIEGFPNVLLQMMAQHDKVVSTKCAGGIAEMPGVVTADTHDKESLKNAILSSLKTDSRKNRYVFDNQLNERSIDKFIEKIQQNLS